MTGVRPRSEVIPGAPVEGEPIRPPARRYLLVVGLALATFGPYVIESVRTEQLAVYGLFLLALPLVVTRPVPLGGRRFLVAWLLYIVVCSLGSISPPAWSPFPPGNTLAGYDNIVLPAALMLLIWAVVPARDGRAMLLAYLRVVAIAMAVNGALALLSTAVDLSAILRPFWTVAGVDTTIAGNAATMGRYSGIFNQPAEAGFMYGVGGLAAIHVWRRRPVLLGVLLVAIALGGIVSVSKVFVFGGLPLLVLYWVILQVGGKRLGLLIALPVLALAVAQSGVLQGWSGLGYFVRLFDWESGDLITLMSGGRTGADSAMTEVIAGILRFSPLVGVGAGGWAVAYDGALAEALVVGGVLGVLLLGIVMLCILLLPRALDGAERWFGLIFGVLVIGGSLGFSPLTANRTSTTAWMIVALLVLVARYPASGRPRHRESSVH